MNQFNIPQELVGKLGDKELRLNHLYKIIDKNQKFLTFTPNLAQQDFLKNKGQRNIILKARQLGFTTLSVIDMLDDALFNKNMSTMLISYDLPSAEGVFYKIKTAWDNFPLKELYVIDAENKRQYRFNQGDGSVSSIEVKVSGRSGTFNRIHITELAKIASNYPQKAEELITGTIPSVPLDGRVDIESTAEGASGIFYEMFMDAWNNPEIKYPTQYKAHFYNWQWDKENIAKAPIIPVDEMDNKDFFRERQEEYTLTDQEISYYYLQWLAQKKDFNKLFQEFPTTVEEAFVASGSLFFSQQTIKAQQANIIEPISRTNNLNIYEDYKPKETYAIGVDVSEGIGRDSSTMVVWKLGNEPAVVADFASKDIAPDQLAYEIKLLGNRYGTPMVGVERNNHGHTTLAKLKEIYPRNRIFTEVKTDKYSNEKTKRLGWLTTSASKPNMLYDLKAALDEDIVKIHSFRLLNELKTYNSQNIQEAKNETNHWDLVIAAAIGWQMRNFAPKTSSAILDRRQQSVRNSYRNSIRKRYGGGL